MSGPMEQRPAWLAGLGEEEPRLPAAFSPLFRVAQGPGGGVRGLVPDGAVPARPTHRAGARAEDARGSDPLEQKVRVLLADGQLSAAAAKELLAAHRAALTERKNK